MNGSTENGPPEDKRPPLTEDERIRRKCEQIAMESGRLTDEEKCYLLERLINDERKRQGIEVE